MNTNIIYTPLVISNSNIYMTLIKQTGKTNGLVLILLKKKGEISVREIGWAEFCGFF